MSKIDRRKFLKTTTLAGTAVGLSGSVFLPMCTRRKEGRDRIPYVLKTDESDRARFDAVRTFADQVMDKGRDRYGEQHTPLFADGIRMDNGEPARWRYQNNTWVISNQANQQHLFRTLKSLSILLEEPKYEEAAKEAIRHMLDHQRSEHGLFYWGGHVFVDLESQKPVTEIDVGRHELKWHYPYYPLMWETDPVKTNDYLKSFWNCHIWHWHNLTMNRHAAPYDRLPRPSRERLHENPDLDLWDSEFELPEPFFEADNCLSFLNTGADMIYAAGERYLHSGDPRALTWCKRMAHLYVHARHPDTHLGVYQYSQPKRLEDPPEDPSQPGFTHYRYGDRAQRQLGPEFGEIALEGNLMNGDRGVVTTSAIMQLHLAKRLGREGDPFLEWTHAAMRSYAEHAHIPERNALRPMWADGTDLTGYELLRPGYYGPKGRKFQERNAGLVYFYSYTLGYMMTDDEYLWSIARSVAQAHDLGDPGRLPGQGLQLNMNTRSSDPVALFTLIELFNAGEHQDYLDLARNIGNNILERCYHHRFFLAGSDRIYSRFNLLEPHALLVLDATLRGVPDAVPPWIGGGVRTTSGRFDGTEGRSNESREIWNQTW